MLLLGKSRKHLSDALKRAGDTHTVDDVIEMIENGDARLYKRKKSTVVTQEFDLPAARQLHFWLAGGDLDDLIQAEREIVEDAKERGINKVTIIGQMFMKEHSTMHLNTLRKVVYWMHNDLSL